MAVAEAEELEIDHEDLDRVWEDAPGLAGFFSTVDHKRIGIRYIYTAFIFFVIAGLLALVMRVQLTRPDSQVLSPQTFNPGINMDFWGLGIVFVGISTTVGAINFIVTTFKMRAPGMTINRMPIFVWSMLSMAFMVLFAVPAITVATALLELDRLFGTA